ncbi:hypothetical protein DFH11DRAFT_1790463 [Phellopilus nigrolimitatus]|nr:hypothetical protein DFH11DRAFT_1790463 [Phellopilus nigrolimitatus]
MDSTSWSAMDTEASVCNCRKYKERVAEGDAGTISVDIDEEGAPTRRRQGRLRAPDHGLRLGRRQPHALRRLLQRHPYRLRVQPAELEGIAPADAQRLYLAKFGFVTPPLPAGFAHRAGGAGAGCKTPPLTPPPVQQNGFDHAPPAGPGEHVTTLVACRVPKDRRRVQPTFLGSLGANGTSTGDAPAPAPPSITINTIPVPPPASASASSTGFGAGMDLNLSLDFGLGVDTDMAVPITRRAGRRRRLVRREENGGEENGGKPAPPPKARTLGGDRPRDRDAAGQEVHEIRWEGAGASASALGLQGLGLGLGPGNGIGPVAGLEAPSLKTFLEARVKETGDMLEERNSEDGSGVAFSLMFSPLVPDSPCRVERGVILRREGEEHAVARLSLRSHAARVRERPFCAVALEDGALHVYLPTRRRIMPMFALSAPAAFLDAAKNFLMAVTTTGQVFVWSTKTATATHGHLAPPPARIPARIHAALPEQPARLRPHRTLRVGPTEQRGTRAPQQGRGTRLRRAAAVLKLYGRSAVRRTSRIANSGCYVMSAQLLLGPLVKAGLVPPGVWLTVFELSGYSGADTVADEQDSSGRPTTEPSVSPVSLHGGVRPYALTIHIHEREAKRHLVALLPAALAGEMKVASVPSVVPWFSGILRRRKVAAREVRAFYNEMYTGEHLITVGAAVLGLADVENKHGWTVGGYQVHSEGGRVVVVGGLDNLLKGAATQFLQNVNLALGYDELLVSPSLDLNHAK